MKTRTLLMCCVLGFLASVAEANMATYFAKGRTIERISTDEIRLVSEHVRVTPSFDPERKQVHRAASVRFKCEFVLENLTDSEVSLLAGFPVSRYRPWSEETPEEAFERFSVMSSALQFSVDDYGTCPEVRLDKLDREGQPWIMMFWDMKFAPGERRCVTVEYRILMWFTGKGFINCPVTPVSMLSNYHSFWFEYVTKTAESWAGKVESVRFEIVVAEFEQDLRKSCMEKERFLTGSKGRELFLSRWVSPSGLTEQDGVLVWTRTGEVPPDGVMVRWDIYPIPTTVLGVRGHFIRYCKGDDELADLADLREYLLGINGQETERPEVRRALGERNMSLLFVDEFPGTLKEDRVPPEVFAAIDRHVARVRKAELELSVEERIAKYARRTPVLNAETEHLRSLTIKGSMRALGTRFFYVQEQGRLPRLRMSDYADGLPWLLAGEGRGALYAPDRRENFVVEAAPQFHLLHGETGFKISVGLDTDTESTRNLQVDLASILLALPEEITLTDRSDGTVLLVGQAPEQTRVEFEIDPAATYPILSLRIFTEESDQPAFEIQSIRVNEKAPPTRFRIPELDALPNERWAALTDLDGEAGLKEFLTLLGSAFRIRGIISGLTGVEIPKEEQAADRAGRKAMWLDCMLKDGGGD